ncbi:MAG: CinA family protein [Limnohabitans sp.]
MDSTALVQQLASHLLQRGWMMVTAESCTGGLIAASCTELAGSSNWFERGFVTYSNAAKSESIGVPAQLLAEHGAVSEAVARAMARGALLNAHAQVSVAVTGIAGPSGGSPDKPVGTVWFAWCVHDHIDSERQVLSGDRAEVRNASVEHALQGLLDRLV